MASYTYMADSIRFTIEGKNAVDAIEKNFNEIATNAHVGNVAGYSLDRVWLQDSVLHIIASGSDMMVNFDPTEPAKETYIPITPSNPDEHIADHEFTIHSEAKKFDPFDDGCLLDDESYIRGVVCGLLDEVYRNHCVLKDNLKISLYADFSAKYPTLEMVNPGLFLERMRYAVQAHRPKSDMATAKILCRVSELCQRLKNLPQNCGSTFLGESHTKSYFQKENETTALAAARKKAGLTQAQAAAAAGISLRQWQYYESGKSELGDARVAAVNAIAAAVGVSTTDILDEFGMNRYVDNASK